MKNNSSIAYSLFLIFGDFLAILAAFVSAYILRVTVSDVAISSPIRATDYFLTFISLVPIWIVIFGTLGLYTVRVYDNRFSEFARLLVGSFIGILLIIAYSYIANVQIFPARLVVLYGFLLAFAFSFVFRTIARGLRHIMFRYSRGITTVLIVGDTKLTQELVQSLNSYGSGYLVVGVVGGKKFPIEPNTGQIIFSSFDEACEALGNKLPGAIIQTELYADNVKNTNILVFAQQHHIDFRFVPGNSELFVGNLEVELFRSIPIIAVHQTALVGWGRVVKRMTDIILSLIALIIASPVMLLVIIAMKLAGRKKIFFRQDRLTRYDRVFKVYKFQTARDEYNGLTPEEAFKKMGKPELIKEYRANGDQLENDPRYGKLGLFMRKTSLDELPQLFNVLKGDISLVGPRPLVPEELEKYQKRHAILSVKSGLTGLAQVSGRRNISFDERRKLDLFYVQNWTFWGDLVIMVRTVWMVLFRKGAN